MTISTAAKAGSGAVFAVGTPASIYFSWDHITLYAVEREVINKDLKLDVKGPEGTNNLEITIKAPESTETSDETKLEAGHSWSCVISVTPKTTGGTIDTGLVDKIKKNLPTTNGTDHKTNKELLVKACAKNRAEGASSSVVKGTLTAKEDGDTTKTLLFSNSELNVLIKEAS